MSLPEVSLNTIPNSPSFDPKPILIKSAWKNTLWNRKQVRVHINDSGELIIQTIAQNTFARIASVLIKTLSCSRFKSFGKKTETMSLEGYLLPQNLAALLSEQKQKDIYNIQIGKLTLLFLPSHKSLNDLGSLLSEYAIDQKGDQAVMEKVMEMHQQILDFQLKLVSQLQEDIPPVELYKKFQVYEAEAKMFCEQYPILLKDFVEERKQLLKLQEIEKKLSAFSDEGNLKAEDRLPSINPTEPLISWTPEQHYTHLLMRIDDVISLLKSRHQFTSMEWLQEEKQRIVAQFDQTKISLKLAIESLEDALDNTLYNVSHLEQLLKLPKDSPLETELKALVIKDITKTIEDFKQVFRAKKEAIQALLGNSKECPWHQSLNHLFESIAADIESLSKHHDSFTSWLPGYHTTRHFIHPKISDNSPFIALENLDRHSLAKHKKLVEHTCLSALETLEKETHCVLILKAREDYQKIVLEAKACLSKLDTTGQFHKLALLENVLRKHEEIVRKNSTSLSSTSKAKEYERSLKKGVEAIQQEMDKKEESDPILQLTTLKNLSSPYYDILHERLTNNAKTQLKAFVEILNSYKKMLANVLPVLKDNQHALLAPALNIDDLLTTKINQAITLTTDFTTRHHFLHLNPSTLPVQQLSPSKLKDYLNAVTAFTQLSIQEIQERASDAGLKFD